MRHRALPLVAFSLLACSATRQDRAPDPSPAPRAAAERARRPAPLEHDVLGWIATRDLDAALATLAETGLRGQLFELLGLPAAVADAVDGHRPVAVALLDPGAHEHTRVPPVIVAVTGRSRAELEAALASAAPPMPSRLPGVTVYEMEKGPVHASWDGDMAFLAHDPQAALGAARVLGTVLRRAQAPLHVHVDLANLGRAQGLRIDTLTAAFLGLVAPGSDDAGELAYRTRQLVRVLAHLKTSSTLDVLLTPQDGGLGLTLRLQGPAEGTLARFVADERSGAPWGAELLPADTMVVYASRLSQGGAASDAADFAAYLETRGGTPPARRALGELAGALEGSVIHGLWPAPGGGLGAGGAIRLSRTGEARALLRAAYGALVPALPGLLGVELGGLPPERMKLAAHVRGGGTVAGVPVDVVEIAPAFGRGATRERRVFEWLFGARLRLGMAVVGDQAVWAAGRDWKPRLAAMIAAARGGGGAKLAGAPAFKRALAAVPARGVSFAYISSSSLAGFVADVLAVPAPLPERARAALAPLRAARDGSGLVVATRVTTGATASYELVSVIPAEVLASMGGLGGAIWRLGLGLVMGPPSLPPLPTPPRLMAPPLAAPPGLDDASQPQSSPAGAEEDGTAMLR